MARATRPWLTRGGALARWAVGSVGSGLWWRRGGVRGLQGLAGLRGDAPSEARGAGDERAGRPRTPGAGE